MKIIPELKEFFAFLYSIGYFVDFEQWLISVFWSVKEGWEHELPERKTILEILKYQYGDKYLKVRLSELPALKIF